MKVRTAPSVKQDLPTYAYDRRNERQILYNPIIHFFARPMRSTNTNLVLTDSKTAERTEEPNIPRITIFDVLLKFNSLKKRAIGFFLYHDFCFRCTVAESSL